MLDMSRTNFADSTEMAIAAGVNQILEGTGLVRTIESGKAVVGNGSAANAEIFAGVAVAQRYPGTTAIMVERVTMSAAAASLCTATLKKIPKAPSTDLLVKNGATAIVTWGVNAAAVDANTKFNTTGTTLTLHSDLATLPIDVTYRYDLSAEERSRMFGDTQTSASVGELTDTIGVIQQGVVFTDMFDPSDDWATFNSTNTLKVGANGVFTMASGATGATVAGSVEFVPTADVPYLGLRIRAA